eukprot:4865975-Pyramimonas_sp.AAC.1
MFPIPGMRLALTWGIFPIPSRDWQAALSEAEVRTSVALKYKAEVERLKAEAEAAINARTEGERLEHEWRSNHELLDRERESVAGGVSGVLSVPLAIIGTGGPRRNKAPIGRERRSNRKPPAVVIPAAVGPRCGYIPAALVRLTPTPGIYSSRPNAVGCSPSRTSRMRRSTWRRSFSRRGKRTKNRRRS